MTSIGQHLHSPRGGATCEVLHSPQGGHVLYSPQGVMSSKLCSPSEVMGGRRTHSVSALLLVVIGGRRTHSVSALLLVRLAADPVAVHVVAAGGARLLRVARVHGVLHVRRVCVPPPGYRLREVSVQFDDKARAAAESVKPLRIESWSLEIKPRSNNTLQYLNSCRLQTIVKFCSILFFSFLLMR